jgi:hypothetical protein
MATSSGAGRGALFSAVSHKTSSSKWSRTETISARARGLPPPVKGAVESLKPVSSVSADMVP